MSKDHVARASVTIHALPDQVWEALVDPKQIKEYMFGTNVRTDWQPGSEIRWKGEWQGKQYEDKGNVLEVKPKQVLKYTHYSPLSERADKPENYHTVTIHMSAENGAVTLSLAQDNNPTPENREHAEKNWQLMLENLKKFLEEERDAV